MEPVSSSSRDWFKHWFNETYLELYTHRNSDQANNQVASLCTFLENNFPESFSPYTQDLRVLDIACGSGRHVCAFQNRGIPTYGVDLSLSLLKSSPQKNLLRADMRYLPFPQHYFDLLTSFFSSFGYFKTPEEDVKTLHHWLNILKKGGFLFLDLANPLYIQSHLQTHTTTEYSWGRVDQFRTYNHPYVSKQIKIYRAEGRVEEYAEQLRLYSLEAITDILIQSGCTVLHVFGTERGDDFVPQLSPRISLIAQVNNI